MGFNGHNLGDRSGSGYLGAPLSEDVRRFLVMTLFLVKQALT